MSTAEATLQLKTAWLLTFSVDFRLKWALMANKGIHRGCWRVHEVLGRNGNGGGMEKRLAGGMRGGEGSDVVGSTDRRLIRLHI